GPADRRCPGRRDHPRPVAGRGIHGTDPRRRRVPRARDGRPGRRWEESVMESTRMTPRHRPAGPAGIRLTPGRVARSEWIKLRSLRSTGWTLAAFAVTTAGAGVGLCQTALSRLEHGQHVGASPAVLSLYGAYLAPVTIGVLGVLVATGEY